MRQRNMRPITADHKCWIYQCACYFKEKKKNLFKKMPHGWGWGRGGRREKVREWAEALRN